MTSAIRLEMFDSMEVIFFRIVFIREYTFMQKVTHTHTYIHCVKQGCSPKAKSAKQIRLKITFPHNFVAF